MLLWVCLLWHLIGCFWMPFARGDDAHLIFVAVITGRLG